MVLLRIVLIWGNNNSLQMNECNKSNITSRFQPLVLSVWVIDLYWPRLKQ